MRVGLDGCPLASRLTGIGHYTLELARSLAAISPADEFELVSPVPLSNSIGAEIANSRRANLCHVTPNTPIGRLWWSAGLPLYFRAAPLDIFHGTNYDVPLWNRSRTVVTIHDLSLLLHADKHQPHLVRRARRRLRLMARLSTMMIAPTEAVKQEICHHLHANRDKIAVTPYAPRARFRQIPGLQTINTRRRLGIEDEFILFVGTLEPRKNLLTLARAFVEILSQTSLRPQLVVAGSEGWLMDDLYSFIQTSGIENRLRFTGYLSEDDLQALYSSCRIFVYPSVYEGFGLPPLEAMACGAPVITSRIPAIQETVGTAAHLVDPNDVQELARSMVELLVDESKRRQFSSSGLERAGRFSWETTARLTLEVYRSVLKNPKLSNSLWL